MKKNIILILVSVLVCGSFSSCQKWLEETDYTYAIATSTFYNTPGEASAAVLSVLDNMRSAFNSNWYASLEINTEYIYPKGVYQASGDYEGITNTTHLQRCGSNYQYLFRAIMRCNTPLSRLPEAKDMTKDEIDAYMGELYFLRAYNYWMLVRTFGGVPLRTEENMYTWDLAKSTPAQVYDLIVADLQKAVKTCPDVERYKGTPCKNAAKAVLAGVYMDLKKYSEAKSLAAEVISSGQYQLIPVKTSLEFNEKVFGEAVHNTPEEVFYIKTNMTDSKTWDYLSYTSKTGWLYDGVHTICQTGYYTHYTDLDNPVIKNWSTDDLRRDLNIIFMPFGVDAYGANTCLLIKYRAPNSSGSKAEVDIPMLRYTDVLFTYAEACARTGETAKGIEVLNQIKRRAYGADINTPNPALDYKAGDYADFNSFLYGPLLTEERYENFNEAKHWFFEERLGIWEELVQKNYRVACPWPRKDMSSIGQPITVALKCHLWKIPAEEFNYNKAMDEAKDQNPGYTN